MNEFEIISNRIDQCKSEAIDFMKTIISIKALGPINGGEGESQKAEFIADYLRTIGFKIVEEYPAPDPNVPGGMRPNLVATIPGKRDNKTVWIIAHMDVVPEGDLSKWDSDPYEGVVKDGKIFGRGSEDNHQGLVGGIIAAKAFLAENMQPEYNLSLMLVADEETGSVFGLQHMVDHHKELFGPDDLIIVPDAGDKDSTMIEVAEKSILWLKIRTLGKQVHASMPELGINAFKVASHLVIALEELHQVFDKNDPVFDPPISTFEPTKKEANVPNVNTIPGEDVFYLDCRVLPDYSVDQVLEKIKEIIVKIENKYNVQIEFSIEQRDEAAPPTPVDAPVVQALESAVKHVYYVEAKPKGIGGGTVAAILRRCGIQAAVWSTMDDMAHQPNEYCRIDNLLNDAKVFAHVCMNTEK
jgi:succinyl-diaminopimelate desuccinylase